MEEERTSRETAPEEVLPATRAAARSGGESRSYSSPPVCGYTLYQVYAGTNGGAYTASLSGPYGGSVVTSCEWSVGPSGTCDGTLGVVLMSSACGSQFACPPSDARSGCALAKLRRK